MLAYYINCRGSTQRNGWMQEHLRGLGIQPVRCEAIEADSVTFEPHFGKLGYACLLSHLWYHNELSNKVENQWCLMLEDDAKLLGVPDVEALVRSAPADASVLQLTTITGSHYAANPELWTRSTGGYYGTVCYLINITKVQEHMSRVGVDTDLRKYLHQGLPHIDGAYLTADSYVYHLHPTYICKYPFAYSDIALGSLLHEDHLWLHEIGWKAVREHAKENKNPFIK